MKYLNYKRDVNIELLRIVAMLMVIILHTLGHGGVLAAYDFGSVGYILFWFIEVVCYGAVNIFVLITGYFMINMQMKLSRIIKLVIQVEFFSLLSFLVARFVFHVEYTLQDVILAVFPLTGNEYWFASAYVILLTLIPLINYLIHHMNKKQLIMETLLLIFVFSFISTFFPWSRNGAWTGGYSFIWFVVVYFIGACVQVCGGDHSNTQQWIIIFVSLSVIHLLIRLVIGYVSLKVLGHEAGVGIFSSYNSLIVLFASVALFMFFKQLQLGNGRIDRIIITLGKWSFGAYLCSDHELIRKPLWKMCDITGKTSSILDRTIYVVSIVLIIFVVGCLIEGFREKFMRALGCDRLMRKADAWFEQFKDKIEKIIENKMKE